MLGHHNVNVGNVVWNFIFYLYSYIWLPVIVKM